jgi:glycosyltransferase involved in cell wall biosynthesis
VNAGARSLARLRVVHCPLNVAGIPWQYVQALRRKDVDARLVVFERQTLHPQADWSLERRGGLTRRLLTQARALTVLLPETDIFHFYFGLTLIPKSIQFPILRLTGKKSVYHFLGSDIRGKSTAQLAFAGKADARIVGNYDDQRWLPDADVVLPGLDLNAYPPQPPSDRKRPLVVHAPSNRTKKGTAAVIRACQELPVDLEIIEGLPNDEARERYKAADIVIDQLKIGWYGVFAIEAMALGKPVVCYLHDDAVRRSEEAFGLRLPLVAATPDTLTERLQPLVESTAERQRVGAASRAYVETVHDADQIADQLIDIYQRIRRT